MNIPSHFEWYEWPVRANNVVMMDGEWAIIFPEANGNKRFPRTYTSVLWMAGPRS